ncbi:hypothetical protein KP509_38G061400 [Ceratopteris richardii]|uniref:Uncharacterized protein n=1 Tax=Ceratopteris richardii TaxID=49495 RepID=A0A8T2Q5E7_CERRI|nr:hypothetical protein KP509_38G061400 [Ceratopteris richardii]
MPFSTNCVSPYLRAATTVLMHITQRNQHVDHRHSASLLRLMPKVVAAIACNNLLQCSPITHPELESRDAAQISALFKSGLPIYLPFDPGITILTVSIMLFSQRGEIPTILETLKSII